MSSGVTPLDEIHLDNSTASNGISLNNSTSSDATYTPPSGHTTAQPSALQLSEWCPPCGNDFITIVGPTVLFFWLVGLIIHVINKRNIHVVLRGPFGTSTNASSQREIDNYWSYPSNARFGFLMFNEATNFMFLIPFLAPFGFIMAILQRYMYMYNNTSGLLGKPSSSQAASMIAQARETVLPELAKVHAATLTIPTPAPSVAANLAAYEW